MSESIEITQHWLGLRPYVLVTLKHGPDGAEDLRADIDSGGGVSGVGDIGEVLTLALSGLPPAANPLNEELDNLVREHPEHAASVAMVRDRFGWTGEQEG